MRFVFFLFQYPGYDKSSILFPCVQGCDKLGGFTTLPSSDVTVLDISPNPVISLTLSGGDATSGIAGFDLQVRHGTYGTWTDLLTNATITQTTYTGVVGETYYFRSRATDNAGNLEPWPMMAPNEPAFKRGVSTSSSDSLGSPHLRPIYRDFRGYIPECVPGLRYLE